MIGSKRFTFPLMGQDAVIAREKFERNVGGETVSGVAHDESRVGFRASLFDEQFRWHAGECVIKPAPMRDAMQIADHIDLWQREQFIKAHLDFIFNQPKDAQSPGGVARIDLWNTSVVEDGPLFRECLARWRSRRGISALRVGTDDSGPT